MYLSGISLNTVLLGIVNNKFVLVNTMVIHFADTYMLQSAEKS